MIDVIPHPELGTNEIDDTGASPEIGVKAGGLRTFEKQLFEAGTIAIVEPWRAARGWLCGESLDALGEMDGLPAMNGATIDTKLCRDFSRGMTLSKEHDGTQSSHFQSLRTSVRSHGYPPGRSMGH